MSKLSTDPESAEQAGAVADALAAIHQQAEVSSRSEAVQQVIELWRPGEAAVAVAGVGALGG